MFKIKKIITSLLLVLLSVTSLSSSPVRAEAAPPPIFGGSGIAIDVVTGKILYNKNADRQGFPASMTKVLTAIVLDERMKDSQMLNVSPNAAGQECSCFGIKAGEQISKKDAMYGLLLLSANDLAVAIAENVGGSVEGFAQLMNDEVKKLGLQHTHFVTPNGLHDPNHYTTPHDMALIMKEALKHPNVLNALSTQSVQIHTNMQDKKIRNKSEVHTQSPAAHVIAGKNGFTDQAGNTLVEYLKDGDKQVISVVMKSNRLNEYKDIQTMANYAFSHMKTEKFAEKGQVVDQVRLNGKKVSLVAPEDIIVTLNNGDTLSSKIQLVSTNGEKVKKGQVVANLKLTIGGQVIKNVPLVTNKAIQEVIKTDKNINQNKPKLSAGVVGILFVFLVLVPITTFMNKKNRKRVLSK